MAYLGNPIALAQKDLKRGLAYSNVSQLGLRHKESMQSNNPIA